MISEETKNQARYALLDLENAVLKALVKLQSVGSLSLKTKYISQELDFTTPAEIQIIKCVLINLKEDDCVENFDDHGDAWQIPKGNG